MQRVSDVASNMATALKEPVIASRETREPLQWSADGQWPVSVSSTSLMRVTVVITKPSGRLAKEGQEESLYSGVQRASDVANDTATALKEPVIVSRET